MRPPTETEQQEINELASKHGLTRCDLPAHLLGTCEISGELCPECGQPMRVEGGCAVCVACFFSKCG